MGIADADSAEHGSSALYSLIIPVSCAVPNRAPSDPKLSGEGSIRLRPDSMIAEIYGVSEVHEQYFCNYEVNDSFQKQFEAAGLRITGYGPGGEARVVELPENGFFLATLFQPQLTSQANHQPHPVIVAYLHAVQAFKATHTRRAASLASGD